MKAFLLYPEFTREFRYADWLEIGTAAALLRQVGWEVEGFHWKSVRTTDRLKRDFAEAEPQLAVTLVHPDQAPMAIKANEYFKKQRPQTITLACGLWPTLAPDAAVHAKVFDALIVSEWEPALAEYALAFENQKDQSSIRNFWLRKRPNEIKRLPIRPPVDPDGFPPPDRDLFPYPQILQMNGGLFPIQASRSCPYHCAFCQEPAVAAIQKGGRNPHRARSPEKVVAEASDLAHVFSPERMLFVDQVFPWDQGWLDEFVPLWTEQVGLPFTITGVSELLHPPVLDRLHAAGCDRVVIGIETGDEELRHTISDRNKNNQSILDLRRSLRARNMELLTTNMLGLPGETPETLEATVQINQKLQPFAVSVRVFDPLPQTPLAESLEREGIKVRSRDAATPDPDHSRLRLPDVTQEQITETYDRLCLLDSVLRSERYARRGDGYFEVLRHFAKGRFLSPWRRPARLATWKRGNDAREVLALRAPAEITFDFAARAQSALAFGITCEPALRGLRPHQAVQFSIKITQDHRTFRIFKKILVPALDPDARRWHDYLFPLREVRPGRCRLVLQVRIDDEELKKLKPGEEIWGGWSHPRVLDQMPAAHATPLPVHAGEPAGAQDELIHDGERIQVPPDANGDLPEPPVSLHGEHMVNLDDEPAWDPGAEHHALIRQVGELSDRIHSMEQHIRVVEADKQLAQQRAEEAEVRAARAEKNLAKLAQSAQSSLRPRRKSK